VFDARAACVSRAESPDIDKQKFAARHDTVELRFDETAAD
jgi:hypothetical protein